MAKEKVFSVGFTFPGGDVEQIDYDSDQTLLDADVIVFEPTVEPSSSYENHQGKPLLSESASFRAKEVLAHWRRELKAAFDAGKVVFVFLAKPVNVFVHTGEKQFSGTGRNRQAINLVAPLSSYSALPIEFAFQQSSGTEVVLSGDAPYLAAYWKEFGQSSTYEVVLENVAAKTVLKTRDGNRIVGAAIFGKRGAIILLPPIRYDEDVFTEYDKDTDEEYWSDEAQQFGKKLIAALAGVADAIHSNNAITPAPDWTQHSEYRLQQEDALEAAIQTRSKEIQSLQQEKIELEANLRMAGALRRLLYETGHQLEEAILEALRLMGFTAEPFSDGKSEFDAVFTGPEGRFLGEAEGKDRQAINIDKLSQLERNLQEDFAREGVAEYAKGVLFGNPYRLVPVSERGAPFTEKCLDGAKRSGIALVFTSDLFAPAKYLKEHSDLEYARQCREAIFRCKGDIVTFPAPPASLQAMIKEAPAENSSPTRVEVK
jgi:hypothetical protein